MLNFLPPKIALAFWIESLPGKTAFPDPIWNTGGMVLLCTPPRFHKMENWINNAQPQEDTVGTIIKPAYFLAIVATFNIVSIEKKVKASLASKWSVHLSPHALCIRYVVKRLFCNTKDGHQVQYMQKRTMEQLYYKTKVGHITYYFSWYQSSPPPSWPIPRALFIAL